MGAHADAKSCGPVAVDNGDWWQPTEAEVMPNKKMARQRWSWRQREIEIANNKRRKERRKTNEAPTHNNAIINGKQATANGNGKRQPNPNLSTMAQSKARRSRGEYRGGELNK